MHVSATTFCSAYKYVYNVYTIAIYIDNDCKCGLRYVHVVCAITRTKPHPWFAHGLFQFVLGAVLAVVQYLF